jgi:uncharacterized protein YjbI with pentapeptide repeats
MADKEHLKKLKQGVEAWNKWRDKYYEVVPDLRGVNLSNANLVAFNFHVTNLSGAILSKANLAMSILVHADLREAKLERALLQDADLQHAKLNQAYLRSADFGMANLSYANLCDVDARDADFYHAVLIGTDLSRADFSRAKVGQTNFTDNDLSSVTGLNSISHYLPSSIGIDTIYKSKGNIPEAFLRGAGVPEDFITYAHALTLQAIQFYSCFISHSSKDQRFCNRLYADLRANAVRTWYFPKDAKWGESVWGEIDRSIKFYDKLVVVCSKNSLQSGPVLREIERSLNREDQEGKNILFPIRIDNYLFEGWQHERKDDVLRKVVGDFRGWNRSVAKYEIAFKKLLNALQAGNT